MEGPFDLTNPLRSMPDAYCQDGRECEKTFTADMRLSNGEIVCESCAKSRKLIKCSKCGIEDVLFHPVHNELRCRSCWI